MVKRTITITTILLLLSMVVGLTIVLNRETLAAPISGTCGGCTWIFDTNGYVLTIKPTDGVSGTLADIRESRDIPWTSRREEVKKLVVEPGVKAGTYAYGLFQNFYKCTEMNIEGLDVSETKYLEWCFDACPLITTINLENFDVSNALNMYGMFYNCNSLKYLDLSGFDTRNATCLSRWFNYCNRLTTIKLGENFDFKGDNITYQDYQLIFPTPSDATLYTKKWIREDKAYGPYTAAELRDNYDGSTMAGTWICERAGYAVSYAYNGPVPTGASELPAKKGYSIGSDVTVADPATAPGYTFSGWSRTGTFTIPEEDIVITGSFIANNNTSYRVEHYFKDIDLDTYTLGETESLVGTTDTDVIAENKTFEGFTFNETADGTIRRGTITGDESLVLKLYYRRNTYNVRYEYTGEVPDGASRLPRRATYEYGEEVTIADDATAEGYTFSGWSIKENFEMPAGDVVITGSFTAITDTLGDNDDKPEDPIENGETPSTPENEVKPSNTENEDKDKEQDTFINSNIKETTKTIYNPKTDDVVSKYLIYGILGTLVLAIIIRIRIKYSRKAKKIQF